MEIQRSIPLLDETLDRWSEAIGPDLEAYRNHVARVVHFSQALRPCTPDEREKCILAGCFHDIGIWTDGTVDYLDPSITVARSFLEESGRGEWADEIASMIGQHHAVRAVRGACSPLVELFRRADWVDVTFGWRRFGLSRRTVREILDAFPNLGFHAMLLRLGSAELFRHGRNPLPMMRW